MKAKLLFYLGGHRHKTQPDVPGLLDLAIDEKFEAHPRSVRRHRSTSAARSPRHPARRPIAWRRCVTAFMAVVSDPVFVTDMGKRNLGIEPLPGAEVQKIIAAAVAITCGTRHNSAGRYLGP